MSGPEAYSIAIVLDAMGWDNEKVIPARGVHNAHVFMRFYSFQ